MARESVFQRRLIKKLEERGAYVVNIWGNGFMKAGIPDLLVCYKGHFLGLELKTDTGKPSELQLKNLDLIIKAGCNGYITVESSATKYRLEKWIESKYPQYAHIPVIDFEILKNLCELCFL